MTSSIWHVTPDVELPAALTHFPDLHPFVVQQLARLGFDDFEEAQAFLHHDDWLPSIPTELPDLSHAVDMLMLAKENGDTVCVWGDFDVDGQTSTTLLMEALAGAGIKVTFYIPDRKTEGHGLHKPSLKKVIKAGANLILTCDCGVTSHDEIDYALQLGAQVIITDHHELPGILPAAQAIVNSQRLDSEEPMSVLCGVGVAYMLVQELYERLDREDETEQWLDLVALGTIADVALLTMENRYLVQLGLPKLMAGERLGIQKLLQQAKTNPSPLLDTDIVGFTLGPRLNAAGRLGSASQGVDLLMCKDDAVAKTIAVELDALNDDRKLLCTSVEDQAVAQIEADLTVLEKPVLIVVGDDWPAGIIGIVASRMVERYQKPTIMLSVESGGIGRASARSSNGLHLQDSLSEHNDFFIAGGGHKMAAGFSIEPDKIPAFKVAYFKTVDKHFDQNEKSGFAISSWLPVGDLTIKFLEQLYILAPFGAGNPKPTFGLQNVRLNSVAGLGKSGLHTKLIIVDENDHQIKALWWRMKPEDVPADKLVDVICALELNTFRGNSELRVVVQDIRPAEGSNIPKSSKENASLIQTQSSAPNETQIQQKATPSSIDNVVKSKPVQKQSSRIEFVDLRGAPARQMILKNTLSEGGWQTWAEGIRFAGHKQVVSRYGLEKGKNIIVWTIPPAKKIWEDVIKHLKPERVMLLTGEMPAFEGNELLIELKKIGLQILSNKGSTGKSVANLKKMSASFGCTEASLVAGFKFWASRGIFSIQINGSEVVFSAGGAKSEDIYAAKLKHHLEETLAWQKYFMEASLDQLT